jgi:hypothetical protein
MLPDFRFVIGAVLATVVLGVTSFGLLAAVRLTHHGKVGPLESSRHVAFDDRADWNQFNDPDSARRFEELAHKSDAADAAAERAAARPVDLVQPVAAADVVAPDHDPAGDSVAPPPNATVEVVMAPPVSPPPSTPPAPAEPPPASTPPLEPSAPPAVDAAFAARPSEPPPVATPAVTSAPEMNARVADVPATGAPATGEVAPSATAIPEPSEARVGGAPAAPPVADTAPTDEPAETGALAPASAAVTSMTWDEEPNLIVEDKPPAAADRVAAAPATTPESDATKSDATKTDAAKAEDAPTAPPLPAAKPAATAAPVRHVALPAKAVVREREPAPVRTVTAPRPRAAAPRRQYAPQNYRQQYGEQPYGQPQQLARPRPAQPQYAPQQYAPQQYAPQQLAPRQRQQPGDTFGSPSGARSPYGG